MGDADAFAQLFERLYDRVYSTALQYCKITATAEDVAQQVFLKVWEKRQLLATIKNAEAWLFTIARNQVMDVLRRDLLTDKYSHYILEIVQEEENSPEQLLISRQKQEIIDKCVQGLSPKQLEVYRLNRDEGLTYQEIAHKLGISRDTVKEHIAKALNHIRVYLMEHRDELIILFLSTIPPFL